MRGLAISVSLFLICLCEPIIAQPRVAASNLHERIYAILPMQGTGSWDDPKRPLFAPIPAQMKPGDRSGIIAFHHEMSDDGKFALVEFVMASRGSVAPVIAQITQARITGAQVFHKGVNTRAEVETAFKALKKSFDFQKFEMRAQ